MKRTLANGRTDAHADARAARDADIATLRRNGYSLRKIGRRHRLSPQRVSDILAEQTQ